MPWQRARPGGDFYSSCNVIWLVLLLVPSAFSVAESHVTHTPPVNIECMQPSYSRLQKCLEKHGAWRPQKKKSNATNLKLTTYNKPPCLYYALVKCCKAWISLKLKYPSIRIRADCQCRKWYSLWPFRSPPAACWRKITWQGVLYLSIDQ